MVACHLRAITTEKGVFWRSTPDRGGQSSGTGDALVRGPFCAPVTLFLEGLQDRHHDLVHVLVEELAGPEEHCGSDEAERRHDEERGAQVLVEDRRQRAADERRSGERSVGKERVS